MHVSGEWDVIYGVAGQHIKRPHSSLIAGTFYFSYLLRVSFSPVSLFHSVNYPQGRTPFGKAPNHFKILIA